MDKASRSARGLAPPRQRRRAWKRRRRARCARSLAWFEGAVLGSRSRGKLLVCRDVLIPDKTDLRPQHRVLHRRASGELARGAGHVAWRWRLAQGRAYLVDGRNDSARLWSDGSDRHLASRPVIGASDLSAYSSDSWSKCDFRTIRLASRSEAVRIAYCAVQRRQLTLNFLVASCVRHRAPGDQAKIIVLYCLRLRGREHVSSSALGGTGGRIWFQGPAIGALGGDAGGMDVP